MRPAPGRATRYEEMKMDSDKIVRDFCAAWGRGDVDAIVDAFSEDAVYHNIPMAPCKGKDAIRAFIGGMLGGMGAGIPGLSDLLG